MNKQFCSHHLSPETILKDRYMVNHVLGEGGFVITYAATDLNNAQRVAIQEYFPTSCAARTQRNQVTSTTGETETYQSCMKRFLEEAEKLSSVGTLPSLAGVIDFFEANGTAYLVMEFVDGVSLHQIVTQKGRMSADELLPKLPVLLTDLGTLHKAGIFHLDICPDNLILTPDGTPKLLNFSSAWRKYHETLHLPAVLKTGYAPIELYRHWTVQGPWIDVYAIAATIYYCLTGVTPPHAVDRLCEDELIPPRKLGANITEEQEYVLIYGMELQPKKRFHSAKAFQTALFWPEDL